ncbi:MAG: hypothetical protein WAN65_18550 [Candidatus Sulfotelmatobacter sp.]
MIKATAKGPDGRTMLLIGLSFGNLDKFRAEPGDTFIKINGREIDCPIDIVIFSGETEAKLAELVPIAEWLTVKTAYNTLRLALCDIEGGMPTTLQEARDIATVAIGKTPRTI